MKFFTVVLFAILAIASTSVVTKKQQVSLPTSVATILSPIRKERLKQKVEAVGGCNANICFAIDGSGSISDDEFRNEVNFVMDTVSVVVDGAVELSAVQYATSIYVISPLTPDDESFILDMNSTQRVGGESFVVGGINQCFSRLFRRRGEANHIVLLGDGRSTIGGDAIKRADRFRQIGGSLSVVGAGFKDKLQLLAIAGGNEDLVHEVDNFLDVLKLEIFIEQIVENICQVQ